MSRTAIVKALKLPTNYAILESARGNLRDGRYVELAVLHSGTGGHTTAIAKFTHADGWKEITPTEFKATIKEMFGI